MTDNLPSTPEGDLIRRAREVAIPKLSIRAAAKRIGMSPDHWGYVERGYRYTTQGEAPRPFSAPAATVAKMAHAVGITSDELAEDGQRLDAADILIGIEHQEVFGAHREARLVAPVAVPAPMPGRPDRPEIPFDDGDPVGLHPWRQQVLREVYAAVGIASRLGPGELPDPSELPGAEATLAMLPPSRRPFRSVQVEADTWDDTELLLNERVSLIAMMRRLGAVADELEHRRPA